MTTVDTQALKTNFEAMGKELAKLKKEYQKTGQQIFKIASKEVFANHPSIHSATWVQRGPSSEDGDSYPARVHFYMSVKTVESTEADEDEDYQELDGSKYDYEYHPKEQVDFAKDFVKLMRMVGEDILLQMFGQDTKVTVDRKGNTSHEEYYPY
jgi:hypothetical protein